MPHRVPDLAPFDLHARPGEFARILARAVDAKAGYFPGHSDGVAYIMRMMATEAGYPPNVIRRLELAAMLHDVGKLLVPDAILIKPARLTTEEMDVMKLHPGWGREIAQAIEGMEELGRWIYHHHEHFDGSGYPSGLIGAAIPWPSRMLLVADAFHVMTNERSYSQPMTRLAAIEELRRCAGWQFCPEAVAMASERALAPHDFSIYRDLPPNPPALDRDTY